MGVQAANPIAVRGDLLQFDIKAGSGKKASVEVKVPDGWTVLTPKDLRLDKGASVIIQTPHTAKFGAFQVNLSIKVDGGAAQTFTKKVDLVQLVGKRR